MVNFQFNLASVSGIVLAVGGAALYAVRSFRPQLARDSDIFFSAVGLLCGLILIFYGWRFDPIMQFGQVLLTGASVYFVIENLRLRKISTEQAKQNTPIVDSDRPVNREYRADFEDNYSVTFGERENRARIRDVRRPNDFEDEFDERPVRQPSRSNEPRLAPADRRNQRTSRSDDSFLDEPSSRQDLGDRPARSRNTPKRSTRTRRSVEDVNRPDDGGYVDYRPINQDKPNRDSWGE